MRQLEQCSDSYTLGQLFKSWKEAAGTLEKQEVVWVQWPGEWKLCKIKEVRSNKVVVLTPHGGSLDVTNPKSMRFARLKGYRAKFK